MDRFEIKEAVSKIPELIDQEGYVLCPGVLDIAEVSLIEVDHKYGEFSDNPLTHHNAEHSLGNIVRGIRLTNMLREFLAPKYRPYIYELVILSEAAHDYEQGKSDRENVQDSIEFAITLAKESDNPELKTEEFLRRLGNGILVSEVSRGEDNRIEQPNLGKGDPDALEFITSFVDINPIAMEGPKRMITDVTNLVLEFMQSPTLEGYRDFYISQIKFLRRRLNNHRIEKNISYYFPGQEDAVFTVLKDEFNPNIILSYELAHKFQKDSKFDKVLEEVLDLARQKPFEAAKFAVVRLSEMFHIN